MKILLLLDIQLKQHIVKTVRCIACDGAAAERRAVALATRELLSGATLVIRDPAHALRIAIKQPLHSDAVFGSL